MSTKTPLFAIASVVVVLSFGVASASAQTQTSNQQKCLNALNKDGAAVAKAQGKENVGCLKAAGKGKLGGSAQACLIADAKLKVQKKRAKTSTDEAKSCGTAPSFGYTSATTINDAAVQAELDLMADVFGPDLQAVVIDCDANKAGCQCQLKVSQAVDKLAATKLGEFLKCKKAALKAGASSAASLSACVDDAGTSGSIAADTKGKVQKGIDKVHGAVTKCGAAATGAFPGECNAASGLALTSCLDAHVECRVCQMLNEMDGLFVNCDLFDDDAANGSCASGTGPTPAATPVVTPTATATQIATPTISATPTATPTFVPGSIFRGAISKTAGLWNYDGVNGQPGGELECNDHFPGSHLCTFDELEAAEALGELDGAVDVDGQTVTSFWAVIPSAGDNSQCISTVGSIRWFYGTAHTPSRGVFANLTNATGALSDVQAPIHCIAGNHSVGCCVTP